jgi:hypothetical protein
VGRNDLKAKRGQEIGCAIPNVHVVLDEQHLRVSGHNLVSCTIVEFDLANRRFQAPYEVGAASLQFAKFVEIRT